MARHRGWGGRDWVLSVEENSGGQRDTACTVTQGTKPAWQGERECSRRLTSRETQPLPRPQGGDWTDPCGEQTQFNSPRPQLGDGTMRPALPGGRLARELGLWIRLTQAAPGHNGARVACGDTLQHCSLVYSQGEVLRPHKDGRLLVGPRA